MDVIISSDILPPTTKYHFSIYPQTHTELSTDIHLYLPPDFQVGETHKDSTERVLGASGRMRMRVYLLHDTTLEPGLQSLLCTSSSINDIAFGVQIRNVLRIFHVSLLQLACQHARFSWSTSPSAYWLTISQSNSHTTAANAR